MKKDWNIERWLEDNKNKHKCECGCGEYVEPTRWRYSRGKRMRFINLHQNRGINHPHYGDGQVIAKGYVWILLHGHPRSTPRGYVKRCWLVMEKKLGRYLRDDELVHHRNGNKLDDSLDNLEVTDRVRHGKIHNTGSGNMAWRADIDTERDIIPLVSQGIDTRDVAGILKCSKSTIVKRIRRWRNQRTMTTALIVIEPKMDV